MIRIDHINCFEISKYFWKTIGLFDVQDVHKNVLSITKLHEALDSLFCKLPN